MNPLLDTLHARLAIWKCNQQPVRSRNSVSSGFAELDEALPDGGWPQAGLLELLGDRSGVGELSLLLPALTRLGAERGVLLVAPPFVPYAPALAQGGVDLRKLLVLPQCAASDALAAAELALRSGACGGVLLWEAGLSGLGAKGIPYLALKRLQLAAARGNTMMVLYRAQCHASQPSPAALRMRLSGTADGLRLTLFKRRGMAGEQTLTIDPWPLNLQQQLAHRPAVPAWYAIPSSRLERRPALAG